MLMIKPVINLRYFKLVDLYFVKSEYFSSLEVVDRVTETQLQVGEITIKIIWPVIRLQYLT